jgi:hypothetical protein
MIESPVCESHISCERPSAICSCHAQREYGAILRVSFTTGFGAQCHIPSLHSTVFFEKNRYNSKYKNPVDISHTGLGKECGRDSDRFLF